MPLEIGLVHLGVAFQRLMVDVLRNLSKLRHSFLSEFFKRMCHKTSTPFSIRISHPEHGRKGSLARFLSTERPRDPSDQPHTFLLIHWNESSDKRTVWIEGGEAGIILRWDLRNTTL